MARRGSLTSGGGARPVDRGSAAARVGVRTRRPWNGITPRLITAAMVPVVALSALGVVGVVQRYREAGALSGVVTQVRRVEQTLALYAGLVGEKSGSESVVIASVSHITPAQASRLIGYDIVAQLRTARASVDAALAAGGSSILSDQAGRLGVFRADIDAGTASESAVRSFFLGGIATAESAWLAQMNQLTETSLSTVGSVALRRAVAGLADAVDAFIAGADATTAAGSLTVPGVPGAATGVSDLAAATALYGRSAAKLESELRGRAASTWRRLIAADPQVRTFERYITTLLHRRPGASGGVALPELARTFRNGLLFQHNLGRVVDAAAAEIQPIAEDLQRNARTSLERYLALFGLIASSSAAVAVVTARKIVRPLRVLAVRAAQVSAGTIDGEPIDVRGPHEVASVSAAFNEIIANLSALDASARALAAGDMNSPALATPVPGQIGNSLRHSVDLLQTSIRDNDELRQNLALSETRFRELADGSPDVVFRFTRNPEPHFDYLSPSFEHLTGITVEAAQADIRVFAAAIDDDGLDLLIGAAASGHLESRFDIGFRRADRSRGRLELRVVETASGWQGVGRDVTEIRTLQEQLAEQATRDPLTGLANRRLLDELLDRSLHRAERAGGQLAVAFLDLDNFKSVNDTYGHEAGDAVLRTTAARLQTAVRDADVVARYGGDEFVIVYECADDEAGERLTGRIEAALSAPIDIGNGITVCCRPSIGIADTRTTAPDATSLIDTADHAMLEQKMARAQARSSVRIPR